MPFEIKECSVGTGASCGAFRLDEGFERVLREKLGEHADTLLKPRVLAEALDHFDAAIKRQFDPCSTDCEEEYEIPLTGASDIPALNVAGGYLTLQKFSYFEAT